jgi:thioredoxin-like negative regulator of GroEL
VLANGKPTLLVFTDHHCAACLSMVPILERLTERYRGRANILTLDPQDPNLAVRVLSAKYGVWATPMLVVLDATGAVQKKRYGPQREKTLLADLDGLLHRAR